MGLQAMKVFPRNEGVDALEEAYLLAKLSHSNIVRMFEANEFEWEGERFGYFSMEYVEGGTLLSVIPTDLSLDARIGLAKDILEGLAFAHSQVPPVIHRDISPANILVEKSQNRLSAKISDFGLAKHVDSQSLMASAAGKYLYMAPESFLGMHSTATDVYSAGIVLFELFTGRHPFRVAVSASATPAEIASVVRQSRSQSIPDVGDSLDSRWNELFQAALAQAFEDRPKHGTRLVSDLSFDRGTEPSPDESGHASAIELVNEAKRLAQQADTLDAAINLLERACDASSETRLQYSELLSLWKRGIIL